MFTPNFALDSFLRSLIKIAFVALLIAPAASITVSADYEGKPVTQERLETVLRGKQLSTGQIVETIKKKGVNFQLTAETERRLIAAGARPQVLEAIRQNFRQDITATPANSAPGNSSPTTPVNNKTLTGAPLTKDAVIVLLQNGVPVAQVQKNIGARGVNFQMNPEIAGELKAEGANDALIGTIFGAYVAPANSEVAGNSTTNGAAANNTETTAYDAYDELINRAIDTYNSDTTRDSSSVLKSIQILNQAVALDRNNPRAYQSLGFQKLYGVSANNFGEVEGFFSKAIELGGNAVVRVYHDHNGVFTDVCEGSLYISKTAARFESDNNVHTFETTKDNIQQVKTNNPFKQMMQEKKGSYKIVLKSEDDKGVKFSFAPYTQNLAESQLVVRLVGKN